MNVASTRRLAGGAANSAVNLRALGSQVSLVSVAGIDPQSAHLRRILDEQHVSRVHLHTASSRSTLSKHRLLAENHLIARVDQGSTDPIDGALEKRVVQALQTSWSAADVVVIADYGYGVLMLRVIEQMERLQRDTPRIIVLDSKQPARFAMVGVTVAKPNYAQAIQLLGLEQQTGSERCRQIQSLGDEILRRCGCRIAAVTLDQEGAVIFQEGQPIYRSVSKPVAHSTTAGAGDTYLATFARHSLPGPRCQRLRTWLPPLQQS